MELPRVECLDIVVELRDHLFKAFFEVCYCLLVGFEGFARRFSGAGEAFLGSQ